MPTHPVQPYYAAFLRAHGLTTVPPRHHAYIAWITRQWREWDRLCGRSTTGFRSDQDHAAFGLWLAARVPDEAKAA